MHSILGLSSVNVSIIIANTAWKIKTTNLRSYFSARYEHIDKPIRDAYKLKLGHRYFWWVSITAEKVSVHKKTYISELKIYNPIFWHFKPSNIYLVCDTMCKIAHKHTHTFIYSRNHIQNTCISQLSALFRFNLSLQYKIR